HAVIDGRVGRDKADLMPHKGGLREDIVAGDGGAAAGGTQDRAEDAEQGRFAGAIGAEEAVDLTWAGRERNTGQGNEPAAAKIGVRLRQVANFDHEHPYALAPRPSCDEQNPRGEGRSLPY